MKTFLLMAVALVLMHFNQLNAIYWVSFAVFTLAAFKVAYKLDKNERSSKGN